MYLCKDEKDIICLFWPLLPCLSWTSQLYPKLTFPHKPRELIKIVCFVSVCVCDKSFKSVEAPRVALLIHLSRFIGVACVCKVALSVLFTSQLPTK